MKVISTICIFTNLSVTSIKQIIKPKFCTNCQHFISTSNGDDKFGKCGLFPKIDNNKYFLVNGVKEEEEMDYHYCETTRTYANMCGENGDFYRKKYTRKQKGILP